MIVKREGLPLIKGMLKSLSEMRHYTIGFTNGCFDVLHAGHIHYLKQCKDRCDVLVLAVNGDVSTRHLKGVDRPRMGFDNRVSLLDEIGIADFIVELVEPDPRNLLGVVMPDVFFKSDEYRHKVIPEDTTLAQIGADKMFIPIKYDSHSSTVI